MAQESLNPFEIAQKQFDLAAEKLGLDDGMREALRNPRRQLLVSVPIVMDDGTLRVFAGYRVQHNVARGPALGGVRYHSTVTLDGIKALAAGATWKCAIVTVPYGGGAGGVACDARRLSRGERERLTRRYASEIALVIGPGRDIPTPDVCTDGQTMAWILDTWSMTRDLAAPGVVAGKPRELGGSAGGREATARGAAVCIREACALIKKPLKGATVAVQGYGSVGATAARQLHQDGARVVAVSDSKGGAHSSKGLDLLQVEEHKARTGSVAGFKGAERITNEELLELKCDVLVPAALEGQITTRNASRVRARVLAEAASGPTTPAADRILREHGVFVIPDILCGAGGAIMAHLEWAQGRQGCSWEEAEVNRELEKCMKRAFAEAHLATQRHKTDMRTAASILAVGRVAEATRLRGLFP